jgi:oligopeptide/dipeptide ABC transporter ATP-binding protein
MPENAPLVEVQGLRKLFPVESGLFRQARSFIHAVDGIDFRIEAGRTLGLVGESGCGKTTTGKLLVRLLDPTDGKIYVNDPELGETVDLAELKGRQLKAFRRRVQMIFQDPYESLNPRRTVFDTVAEPLVVQDVGTLSEREERVANLLQLVGLSPPSSFLFRFPHELSGGQRQRVAIARALVIEPVFVVCDEPTSMLDVSIRTGVMELMMDLADRFSVSYLYITHDLAVARYMCQEIAVMYLGKIVERAETEELLSNPLHPYTRALISAVPVPDPEYERNAIEIEGGIAAPIDPGEQCRFYDRCPMRTDRCALEPAPALVDRGGGHFVACHEPVGKLQPQR